MKKIPTVFKRIYENGKVVGCSDEFTSDITKQAFLHGTPTIKWDGVCCAIINGEFYKRYDAKQGKTPPISAIPCCAQDPVTGHWPHWVKIKKDDPADKWFVSAHEMADKMYPGQICDGTYEAIGKHFQGNPYKLSYDILIRHGHPETETPRTFDGIKDLLRAIPQEGFVYWLDGEPEAKIKRTDFGFNWPV